MNFKKGIVALVAVTLTNFAFAGNTSKAQLMADQFVANQRQAAANIQHPTDDGATLQDFIHNFFGSLDEVGPMFNLPKAETEQAKKTDQAVEAGLITFANHLDTNSFNEQDKAIMQAFETDIPNFFQEMLSLQSEVDENMTIAEMKAKIQQLTVKGENLFKQIASNVVKNQTEVAADQVDITRAGTIMQVFYTQIVTMAAMAEMQE